ncbi:hypothetical protein DRP05_05010 [Archaeoglobales archaeon]|nr:MAG: hypothetical protein DRP05_05010 [Archaeoglobales archaeon]
MSEGSFNQHIAKSKPEVWKLEINFADQATRILSLTTKQSISFSGAEIGFLLAWMTKDILNTACVKCLWRAIELKEMTKKELRIAAEDTLRRIGLEKYAERAIRRLRDLGILRLKHGSRRLKVPDKTDISIDVKSETVEHFLLFYIDRMKPFVRRKEEEVGYRKTVTITIDGVALAYAYHLSEHNTLVRSARVFSSFLAPEVLYASSKCCRAIGKELRLRKRHAEYVGQGKGLHFCNECLKGAKRKVRSWELAVALRKLSTKTGRAELALLRHEKCIFENIRNKEERVLKAMRNQIVKISKYRLSKTNLELRPIEVADYELPYSFTPKPKNFIRYPMYVVCQLSNSFVCGLAASYVLTKLREKDKEDVYVAEALLRAASNAYGKYGIVAPIQKVVELLMQIIEEKDREIF